MDPDRPLVLIASISPYEGRSIESSLEATGFAIRAVADPCDAGAEIAARRSPAVLVIDSGLLEARHAPEWRSFRESNPGLGTVVRRLAAGAEGGLRSDGRTFLVDPDDHDAICRAVRMLARAPDAAG